MQKLVSTKLCRIRVGLTPMTVVLQCSLFKTVSCLWEGHNSIVATLLQATSVKGSSFSYTFWTPSRSFSTHVTLWGAWIGSLTYFAGRRCQNSLYYAHMKVLVSTQWFMDLPILDLLLAIAPHQLLIHSIVGAASPRNGLMVARRFWLECWVWRH